MYLYSKFVVVVFVNEENYVCSVPAIDYHQFVFSVSDYWAS